MANIWRLTLINSSFITDTEVQESIRLAEQERDISFIKLPLSKFKNSLEYNENDLNDFYQDNIGLYSEPEKVKVDYLILSSKDLEDDIQISEADIQEEYSDYLENFDDTIRKSVSHIMLNINDARDLTEASNNLDTVKKRIQEGETFESLVLEISEDEGTINTNGDLGITDGTLLPPEFELALNSMQEGEVFGPIVLLNSAHLIKLVSLNRPDPEALEERSDFISKDLTSKKAEEDYFQVLDNVTELSYSLGNISDISDAISIPFIESEYFTRNTFPQELRNDSIDAFLFTDSPDINFSEVVELSPTSFALIQLKDFVEERQMEFEEIKDELESDYIDTEVRLCLLYTSPSPRDATLSRMPSSA